MEVKRLMVLREVARQGSLAKAGEVLGYTQPGVSHHVRQLEREVGTPLVRRAGRGIQLTQAGKSLIFHADAIARHLRVAEEEVADIVQSRGALVRIAAFPSACSTLLPLVMQESRTRFPDLDIHLTEVEPVAALKLLTAGDVDLVISFDYAHNLGQHPGFLRKHLFDDSLCLVLPENHPLAEQRGIDLAGLADEVWITGCERCKAQHQITLREAGLDPAFAFETDDYIAVQSLVAAGAGVALLPAMVFNTVSHSGVVAVKFDNAPTREICAVVNYDRRPQATNAVLSLVEDVSGRFR